MKPSDVKVNKEQDISLACLLHVGQREVLISIAVQAEGEPLHGCAVFPATRLSEVVEQSPELKKLRALPGSLWDSGQVI